MLEVGFIIVAGILLLMAVLCQCWRSAHAKAKALAWQEAFDALLLHTLRTRLTQEEVLRLSEPLHRQYPMHCMVFTGVKSIRESIDMALGSKNRETAESRMTYAAELVERIINEEVPLIAVSPYVLDEIRTTLKDTQEKFKTVVHINASRGHVEKALSLKTDKAKRKHFGFAVEEIAKGLATGRGDAVALASALASVEERISQLK